MSLFCSSVLFQKIFFQKKQERFGHNPVPIASPFFDNQPLKVQRQACKDSYFPFLVSSKTRTCFVFALCAHWLLLAPRGAICGRLWIPFISIASSSMTSRIEGTSTTPSVQWWTKWNRKIRCRYVPRKTDYMFSSLQFWYENNTDYSSLVLVTSIFELKENTHTNKWIFDMHTGSQPGLCTSIYGVLFAKILLQGLV